MALSFCIANVHSTTPTAKEEKNLEEAKKVNRYCQQNKKQRQSRNLKKSMDMARSAIPPVIYIKF